MDYFKAKTDSSGQFRDTAVIPEAVGKNDFWIYAGEVRSAVAHV